MFAKTNKAMALYVSSLLLLLPTLIAGQIATGAKIDAPLTENCFNGTESPMLHDVPYFNLKAQKDCAAEGFPGPSCGFQTYLDNRDVERNNLVSSKLLPIPVWTALDKWGNEFGKAGEIAAINLRFNKPGIILTPHWHRNTELTFVSKGRAKVTVSGPASSPLVPKKQSGVSVTRGSGFPIELSSEDEIVPTKGGNLRSSSKQLEESSNEEKGYYTTTFIANAGEGYYVPLGFTHQVQSISEEGDDPMEVLIVFDIGKGNAVRIQDAIHGFSNNVELLAKTLNVPESLVDQFQYYDKDHFYPHPEWTMEEGLAEITTEDSIFKVPQLGEGLIRAPRSDVFGDVFSKFVGKDVMDIMKQAELSVALTEIAPGARMEPYYVTNADELILVMEGEDLEFQLSQEAKDCLDLFTVQSDYLVMHEYGRVLTVSNNGNSTARIYRLFNSNQPEIMTLHDAYYSVPKDVVKSVLYPNAE